MSVPAGEGIYKAENEEHDSSCDRGGMDTASMTPLRDPARPMQTSSDAIDISHERTCASPAINQTPLWPGHVPSTVQRHSANVIEGENLNLPGTGSGFSRKPDAVAAAARRVLDMPQARDNVASRCNPALESDSELDALLGPATGKANTQVRDKGSLEGLLDEL